jgi:hypothetical protein
MRTTGKRTRTGRRKTRVNKSRRKRRIYGGAVGEKRQHSSETTNDGYVHLAEEEEEYYAQVARQTGGVPQLPGTTIHPTKLQVGHNGKVVGPRRESQARSNGSYQHVLHARAHAQTPHGIIAQAAAAAARNRTGTAE